MSWAGGLRPYAPEVDKTDEVEALRKLGVNLSPDHEQGYIRTSLSYVPKSDSTLITKPWEKSIAEQMGPETGPMMCSTVEGWNNEEFLFEVRAGIAYLTMNRPAANNSINGGLTAGLNDAILILKQRPDIRIAVLTGNGRMFCAGGDPKSFQAAQAGAGAIAGGGDATPENPVGKEIVSAAAHFEGNLASANAFARTLIEFSTLPQYTIACLNGSAMGGGVGFVCMCDMAVAVRGAHVTLSEVKLGVTPATISPHVIRTIGTANARRLFCTAENCSMHTAVEMGMVQRVVNDISDFPTVIKEFADKIQSLAPGSVATTKRSVLAVLNQHTSNELIAYGVKEYASCRKFKECEEGMAALAAKKRPPWVERAIDVKGVKAG